MVRSRSDHGDRLAGQLAAAASLACALVSPAAADILHDQRSVAQSGLWDRQGPSVIGGQAHYGLGSPRDQQHADDFTLATRANVTRINIDFCSNLSSGLGAVPAGGFLIEIFPAVGTAPSEVPVFTATSTSYTHQLALFPDGTQNDFADDQRHTFGIDIPGGGVELDAGTWWIAVQAVDLTVIGDQWVVPVLRYTAATQHLQFGGSSHSRAAGQDHGNGFAEGGVTTSPDWRPAFVVASTVGSDMSFSLEGSAVPSPGPVMATFVAGLCVAARRRRR